MKPIILALLGFLGWGAISCQSLPMAGPPTPEHALPGGGATGKNPIFKNDGAKPLNAQAPSREFDLKDPSEGRPTLVELYRQKLRENEELRSQKRADLELIHSIENTNKELAEALRKLREDIKVKTMELDSANKDRDGLNARVLELAMKLAQTEKTLLKLKISALKGNIESEIIGTDAPKEGSKDN